MLLLLPTLSVTRRKPLRASMAEASTAAFSPEGQTFLQDW